MGETEGRKISPVPSIPFLQVLRLALHYKHELSLVLAPLPHAPPPSPPTPQEQTRGPSEIDELLLTKHETTMAGHNFQLYKNRTFSCRPNTGTPNNQNTGFTFGWGQLLKPLHQRIKVLSKKVWCFNFLKEFNNDLPPQFLLFYFLLCHLHFLPPCWKKKIEDKIHSTVFFYKLQILVLKVKKDGAL